MNNKNILKNNFNYIHYTEPNIFNRRNFLIQKNNSTKNKNHNKYYNNIKNLNRFLSSNKITQKNNINKNNYLDRQYDKRKNDIFDMRIYFCLKMLRLSHLQNIFEKNYINFDELLILSLKDLERLHIQKNEQIKIKKFSLDYIKNASYYSLEELENYFRNKKIKKNYKKAISVGNMRIYGNNQLNNCNPINNNIRYDSNNYRNNQQQGRYNSTSIYNNINNIYKNRKINSNNFINYYEKEANNINPNYCSYNFINKIPSNIGSLNMNHNILQQSTKNYYNRFDPSNYQNLYGNEIIETNKNKLKTNGLNKYLSQTRIKNPTFNRKQSIKELCENQKKKINKIFSNKINSIKKRKIDKNMNNNESINNAQFLNEKEFNMFSQIQKLKMNNKKNLIKQKISNKNITNTKINNYINNIYNINKNIQENKIRRNTGNSYRNKLIIQNDIFTNNNIPINLNQLINRNLTLTNNSEKMSNSNYNNMNNFCYYFNDKGRNMTLSNENRKKNLAFKNDAMRNIQNLIGNPY